MEYQAAKTHKAKKERSLLRTIERYEGAMALMAEWEQQPGIDPDIPYLQALRAKATKLRSQLKMKGFFLE